MAASGMLWPQPGMGLELPAVGPCPSPRLNGLGSRGAARGAPMAWGAGEQPRVSPLVARGAAGGAPMAWGAAKGVPTRGLGNSRGCSHKQGWLVLVVPRSGGDIIALGVHDSRAPLRGGFQEGTGEMDSEAVWGAQHSRNRSYFGHEVPPRLPLCPIALVLACPLAVSQLHSAPGF